MNLSFFLGSNYLGSIPALPLVDDGKNQPVYRTSSTALCCPICGEVWGRIMCDYPKSRWDFRSRICRRCHPRDGAAWSSDAGSFLDPEHWLATPLKATNPDLPEDLVRWEFSGLLHHYAKEL